MSTSTLEPGSRPRGWSPIFAGTSDKGKSLMALIGHEIYIEWAAPGRTGDWHFFRLLGIEASGENAEVWLKPSKDLLNPDMSVPSTTKLVMLSHIRSFKHAEEALPKTPTGWIRYRIWDKSGSGSKEDHWLFCPAEAEDGDETVRDYILHIAENWAIHADRYHLDFYRNEVPPQAVIEKQMEALRRQQNYIVSYLAMLNEQYESYIGVGS